MNLFEEIVEKAHEGGVKFTFDTDCQVKGCDKVAIYVQELTHVEHGKMQLELCEKHAKDYDNGIPFEAEVAQN